MHKSRIFSTAALALVAVLLLAACVPIQPEAGGTVPAPAPADAAGGSATLAGSAWILATLNGAPPLEETTITLEFTSDSRAAGSDGCNRFAIGYLAGDGAITFQPGAAGTMMACAEPVMAQATAFYEALVASAAWTVEGDTLTLSDAAGAPLLVFGRQPTELAGTAWQVVAYNNGREAVVSVLDGTALTMVFGADGSLNGSAGCNNYMSGYTVVEGTIRIDPPASTRMFCAEPEGIMEQEAGFLAALSSAATYTIRGDRLEFRTAGDAIAINAVPAQQ